MQLYKLADEFRLVQRAFEDGDIDQETLNDTLECIDLDINDKFDCIAKISAQLNSDSAGLQIEVDRLNKMIKSNKSKTESLKRYCLTQMQKLNKTKIDTSIGSIKITKGRKVVDVDITKLTNEDWVRFVKVTTTNTPIKAEIKTALDKLREGQTIPGAGFVTNPDSIKIS